MKNRIVKKRSWILFLVLGLCLAGCGDKNEKNEPESEVVQEESRKEEISIFDLRQAIITDDIFPEMISVSDVDTDAETLFAYCSDLSYDKVEHFLLSYSAEGKADEVVVILLKEKEDEKEALESLESHRTSRLKLLQQYEPEETVRLQNGEIYSENGMVAMIVSDDNSKVKDRLNNFLSETSGK